eukprot:3804449-Rhodomonas_salina.4
MKSTDDFLAEFTMSIPKFPQRKMLLSEDSICRTSDTNAPAATDHIPTLAPSRSGVEWSREAAAMLEATAKMRENAAPAMRMEAALVWSEECRWMCGAEAALCHGTKGMMLQAQAERGTLQRQLPASLKAEG